MLILAFLYKQCGRDVTTNMMTESAPARIALETRYSILTLILPLHQHRLQPLFYSRIVGSSTQ
jgi:hypothetical protein